MSMEQWWGDTEENRITQKKKKTPIPGSLLPPKISHGLSWDQQWASQVRCQQGTF
jgi:hypothetical protein